MEYHTDPNDEYHVTSECLQFWHKLVALVASVVEEDKNIYTPVLNQLVTFLLLVLIHILIRCVCV